MALNAGDLDRRIVIQRPTFSRAAPLYEALASWATYATVWASKRPATAREMIKAQELGAEIDTVFEIRRSNDVRLVDPTFRIVADGVTHEIRGVLEGAVRGESIVIQCVARNEGGLPAFDYPDAGDYSPSLDFSDARNSMYIPLI